MTMSWGAEIGSMLSAKQLLRDLDEDQLWRHESPNPPASESSIRQAESLLGFSFGAEYASFLNAADGWPAFLQEIDLFGCADLTGEAAAAARELLSYLESEAAERAGLLNGRCFPIGASSVGIDVIVMLEDAPGEPKVIWMAGVLIEGYESFLSFFRAMVSHNLDVAEDLREQNGASDS
ncbi:SMI1/KNR4 family protein [Actinoplanes sp. G11-F43]|uniref:SMI1/KNR4 family protein n=1 Tax=Actinoplanes sp. G11-F43 TaxID=3424130 RepID=UPI003D343987